MIRTQEEHLAHYGILRKSGRYPWGSGNTQSIRNKDFLDYVEGLRKKGMSDAQIAKGIGLDFGVPTSRNDLTAARSIALAEQRMSKIGQINRYREKGWGWSEIGRRMGLNESTVRSLAAPGAKDKATALEKTANMLKNQVDDKDMIDIGSGVEKVLGITKTRLDTAVARLKAQGYVVHNIFIPQVTQPNKRTTMKVLAKPGTKTDHINRNRRLIRQIDEHTEDQGRSWLGIEPPIPVSSRRVQIVHGKEGAARDGMIYVRPGVKRLSIGSNSYGQVRIQVDDSHYLKGMAVYKEDLPPGVDLVFHTKKPDTGRKKDSMQELNRTPDGKIDQDNPFGSIVRQVHDPKTGKVTSAMNLVGSPAKEGSGEAGQWDTWSRNLPSQMLSKQSPKLAQAQLDLTFDRRTREFNEINSLTNPTVRRDLLEKFADETDSAAVHLRAANLPRQATKVLIPVPSMKPTEIYAPTMKDGERVVLIRFPHGGKFEIPELTVNNRNREARKLLGTSSPDGKHDAVGIHQDVAQHLSGADFDGDTVLVIPNNKRLVKNTPALQELQGFDTQSYKIPEGSPIPRMTPAQKQPAMGKISNLITDMSIAGAPNHEIARAVKHSMVVIDAEKHGLNWKQSEKDHGIKSLKEKYQGGKNKGASTIISRAKALTFVDDRELRKPQDGGPIDPVTGKLVYVPTGKTREVRRLVGREPSGKKIYIDTGETKKIQIRSKALAETDDAFTLVSDNQTRMELIYAAHSNRLKAMANVARKESVQIKDNRYSPSAKKTYAKEVESINAKIDLAEKNAPYERQAQLLAGQAVHMTRQSNPGMLDEEVKKVRHLALNNYRNRTGASKTKIRLTQSEWDAIQAGALTPNKLNAVLKNSDIDTVRRLAMPKHVPKMSSSKLARARSMLASGYTQAEVADALGVGLTTLKVSISE